MTTTDITPTTTSLEGLVDRHLAAYCDPDAARRASVVADIWQPDGLLQDPPFDAAGHEAIAAATDLVLGHFPGHRFRRTSAVDAHHDTAWYRWEIVTPDGDVALGGTDVATIRDGRLARIVGFFGDPAPLG